MSGNHDLNVPMAWLCAEFTAENLIASAEGTIAPATFEFRATRDVLALTILFSGGIHGPGDLSAGQLGILRNRLVAGQRWLAWCEAQFDVHTMASTDLGLARKAFRWLARCRTLPTPQHPSLACAEPTIAGPGAGCQVGVQQARLMIDTHLAR